MAQQPHPAEAIATTHYQVLGVKKLAAYSDIKAAFHEKARKLHPDKQTGGNLHNDDVDEFLRIQTAWKVLSNDKERQAYDISLKLTESRSRSKHSSALVIHRGDCQSEMVVVADNDDHHPMQVWTFPCRCGETIEIFPDEEEMLIDCHGCSLVYNIENVVRS